jgi:hypothetical protein
MKHKCNYSRRPTEVDCKLQGDTETLNPATLLIEFTGFWYWSAEPSDSSEGFYLASIAGTEVSMPFSFSPREGVVRAQPLSI